MVYQRAVVTICLKSKDLPLNNEELYSNWDSGCPPVQIGVATLDLFHNFSSVFAFECFSILVPQSMLSGKC